MTSQIDVLFIFIFPQAGMGMRDYKNIVYYHECADGIENSVRTITDWHHEACRVTTNGNREILIFLSHPHTNN